MYQIDANRCFTERHGKQCRSRTQCTQCSPQQSTKTKRNSRTHISAKNGRKEVPMVDTGNVFMIMFLKVCVENDIDRTQNITYPIFHGESRSHFSWRLRSSCGARWLQNEPMAQSRCKWNCLVICDGTDMEAIWNRHGTVCLCYMDLGSVAWEYYGILLQ